MFVIVFTKPIMNRVPSRYREQLLASQQACATLVEENILLREAVETLLETAPDAAPDGLDFRVHPNLFALLGAARRQRSTADYVKMTDGYDQAALLVELNTLLIAGEWTPTNMTAELACYVRDMLRSGIRVVKLQLVAPSDSCSSDTSMAAVAPDEVHIIRLLGAIYEMYVPKGERRWRTMVTQLSKVPCTLIELSDACAVEGDVFVGLLEVVLALIVPNGTRIRLGVVITSGDLSNFYTHGSGNVFWSRAAIRIEIRIDVCTITLLLAIMAARQHVIFVCVNPIGSHLLGAGGNTTFGNHGCCAGRVGSRRINLNVAIRAALVKQLAVNGKSEQEASLQLSSMLDSVDNLSMRVHLAKRRHAKTKCEEEFDEEEEVGVEVEVDVGYEESYGASDDIDTTMHSDED